MDLTEVVEKPLQAVQHPFVFDAEGFRVRVRAKRGTEQHLHARMDGPSLQDHMTNGTSPTGDDVCDSTFYSAQLVHYGLPSDGLKPRAIATLRSVCKTKKGVVCLRVPVTVRKIEKNLSKAYDKLLCEVKESELKATRIILQQHMQKGQEIQQTIDSLEQEILKLQKRKAMQAKNDSNSDDDDSKVDVKDHNLAIGREPLTLKRSLPSETDTERTSESEERKKARLAFPITPPLTPPSTPPSTTRSGSPREADFEETGPRSSTETVSSKSSPKVPHNQVPDRFQARLEYSGPSQSLRSESNPPWAYCPEEHQRRSLLKRTYGRWELLEIRDGKSTRGTGKQGFSIWIGKVFQKAQPQDASSFIRAHYLSFRLGSLNGVACSEGRAQIEYDRLKLVCHWRLPGDQTVERNILETRKLELYFEDGKSDIEVRLYGSPFHKNGAIFNGIYQGPLPTEKVILSWSKTYAAYGRLRRK